MSDVPDPADGRRSSPNAQQGYVLVTGVVVALVLLVAVLAGVLRSSGGSQTDATGPTTTHAGARSDGASGAAGEAKDAPGTTAPVTIVRSGSTTMFATTTVWVTTTTSTTSTTAVNGGDIDVRGGPLNLEPGGRGTLRVANTGDKPMRWAVASSVTGVTVRPSSGSLEPAQTVTVTVSASGTARGTGSLTFISDGGSASVRVSVGAAVPPVSVSFSPGTPTCATSVTVTVTTGGDVDDVTGSFRVDGKGSSTSLAFSDAGNGRWTASIPAQAKGSQVTVTAQVTMDGGATPTASGSYRVGPNAGGSC